LCRFSPPSSRAFFLGEPVHPFTWLASLLAFVGVFIIIRDGLQSSKIIGDIMALVCACCTAAAFTIIRASGKNVATSLGLGSLASAVVALLFFNAQLGTLSSLQASACRPGPGWRSTGCWSFPLSSTLIANGPRYLPSVDVSMFFLLETVLTPVWMWMLFGEIPSQRRAVGRHAHRHNAACAQCLAPARGHGIGTTGKGLRARTVGLADSRAFQFLAQHFQFQPLFLSG
jgi:drug/metabolite transporter (DMT)-like permease